MMGFLSSLCDVSSLVVCGCGCGYDCVAMMRDGLDPSLIVNVFVCLFFSFI